MQLSRCKNLISLSGGNGGGATPVPISNTEVKPSSADGTALVTVWESKSLPEDFFCCTHLASSFSWFLTVQPFV